MASVHRTLTDNVGVGLLQLSRQMLSLDPSLTSHAKVRVVWRPLEKVLCLDYAIDLF